MRGKKQKAPSLEAIVLSPKVQVLKQGKKPTPGVRIRNRFHGFGKNLQRLFSKPVPRKAPQSYLPTLKELSSRKPFPDTLLRYHEMSSNPEYRAGVRKLARNGLTLFVEKDRRIFKKRIDQLEAFDAIMLFEPASHADPVKEWARLTVLVEDLFPRRQRKALKQELEKKMGIKH